MSGGVDSSVTAALVRESGHEVIGVTLQLYDHGQAVGGSKTCCAGTDVRDARRVASALDIPHYVLDYETRFREAVIDDFADSYLEGETPVPCIRCNQRVKFADLLETARDLGADFLATGHYVRRIERDGTPELHCGIDPARDQSYFLFATTRDQLRDLRFPIGALAKDEVRAYARKLNLSVSDKPDSQDICFVPRGGYADVINKIRPDASEPGDILDPAGVVLGRHDGIINFTVGQRRGIRIASSEPLYVLSVNPEKRAIVVGPRGMLRCESFTVRDVNWLQTGDIPTTGVHCAVKVRSTQPASDATVVPLSNERARVVLASPVEAIAPGQACVMYQGSKVLGGGWIERQSGYPEVHLPNGNSVHDTSGSRPGLFNPGAAIS